MYRIIYINIFILIFFLSALSRAEEKRAESSLIFPLKTLFSHKNHIKKFDELGITCTDCHNFLVKSEKKGPLGRPVEESFARGPKGVCHQCHFGKLSFPRPNQCNICHTNAKVLKPKDHLISWRERHGKMAQIDRDQCAKCHTQQTCDQCHTKLDRMNPNVHRANFRLNHSIEARLNPQSCTTCHRNGSFCYDCHFGKVRR
ncbi:MAG: hypothetical protein A2Z91_01525 [Deltaproteobacteria bacterium GWA2_38_16]|nr:MAG: hypothetical protein A2Z91_01525 [Deltaproteobacteria bacterium GWA2_38_16]OGQ03307.1 MAG: hypothetical protein A3D19_00160 [Deltaproteobacteria bacterium RIFCSPHIGHO2_02_FULL_38_15]OGQ30470.1 MAG: hypothetical protein A3A72_08765 [Deltaproteobacteria bacterium RIFCSPLOWO2_01_FULL_38_9]OGQ63179.1 MAG: hypothetical protein A3G92_03790 [Deltaproteobacteria bacterium RIFCSPLOWO2_12_FULL_38_8]